MKNFQLLDFDYEIFGFKVAKILPANLSFDKLQDILAQLKKLDVKLVYWASDSEDEITQYAAQNCQGVLVDRKVTYVVDLLKVKYDGWDKNIAIYQQKFPEEILEKLAIQIGMKSRFSNDKNIPNELMEKVYKLWVTNSVNGIVAYKVLVYRVGQQITGMVTLGKKNNRGDIGLLAVDENFRGKQIGLKLVRAAQQHFINDSYTISQVVTQLDNMPACRLYEKCGYQQEKVENFYHFWL